MQVLTLLTYFRSPSCVNKSKEGIKNIVFKPLVFSPARLPPAPNRLLSTRSTKNGKATLMEKNVLII